MCTCKEMQRGTHAHRASKLGPSNDFFEDYINEYKSQIYLYSLVFITFSHALIEAHTHKHTCMIRAQEEWQQPGTGPEPGWEDWKEGFVNDNSLAHTKKDG